MTVSPLMQWLAHASEAGTMPALAAVVLGYLISGDLDAMRTDIRSELGAIAADVRTVGAQVTDLRIQVSGLAQAQQASAERVRALEARVVELERGGSRGR
jgi:outer membrane murein-binding lipoprotein Lpp